MPLKDTAREIAAAVGWPILALLLGGALGLGILLWSLADRFLGPPATPIPVYASRYPTPREGQPLRTAVDEGGLEVPAALVGESLRLAVFARCPGRLEVQVDGQPLPAGAVTLLPARGENSGNWQVQVPTARAGRHPVLLTLQPTRDCVGVLPGQTETGYLVLPPPVRDLRVVQWPGEDATGDATRLQLTGTILEAGQYTLRLEVQGERNRRVPWVRRLNLEAGQAQVELTVKADQFPPNDDVSLPLRVRVASLTPTWDGRTSGSDRAVQADVTLTGAAAELPPSGDREGGNQGGAP